MIFIERYSPIFSIVLLALSVVACESPPEPVIEEEAWFNEVGEAVGLDFVHARADEIRFYFPEIMSGGAGWIDYNNDGWMDLYLVQGGKIGDENTNPFRNTLYRNVNGASFEDVSEAAGVDDGGYGMGVAVGDYDNDGDTDLYVTNVGPNKLFRNDGAGHFEEVAETAGVSDDGWGTSAAFVDYDGDGLLDLFVVNYIYWTPAQEIECTAGGAGRDYCHPNNYRSPASDVLYRNMGGGRFEDVSTTSGIGTAKANGLGITTADFTGDGLVDFYIANDGDQNQLWVNNGDGTFTDRGLVMGAAVNRQGSTEAGMGVATFDLENDGDLDLIVTHLRDETNTLYRNDGGVFQDITASAGLAGPSIPFTGFGVGVADFDHDTLMDLYVVNGRVGLAGASGDSDPFAEPNQLYRGVGLGLFEEISQPFENALKATSRAAALADYDNDGDLDVVVLNNGGRVHLLQNNAVKKGNWIGFRVINHTRSPAIGTTLTVWAGSNSFYKLVQSAGSYQASHDPRIHVGLGEKIKVDSIIVESPARKRSVLGEYEVDRYHTLVIP